MTYSIVLPAVSSAVEQNAADELRHYLGRATGEEFPVVAEPVDGPGLYVGFTDFAASRGIAAQGGANRLDGAEAWVVRAVDDSLVLTGGRDPMHRGILYAVYHYLEDVIGVRWWNALEEHVPALTGYAIDPGLSLAGEPTVMMRCPITLSPLGDEVRFCVRRRTNQLSSQAFLPPEWGGGVTYSKRGNAHTFDQILPRSEALFTEHPEWFAWSADQRKRIQYGIYCLSDEGLLAAFEEAFVADIGSIYAEADANAEPRPYFFNLSPDDSPLVCECDNCRAIVEKSGHSGYILRFVNRMARAAERVHPGVLVESLAYWFYLEPPLDDTRPAPNVILRVADNETDTVHGLRHPVNAAAWERLEAWGEICREAGSLLGVWQYNVCYENTIVPNTLRTGPMVRDYVEHGVQSLFYEHEHALTSDLWGLKHYLLTHLFEDPHLDQDEVVDDYLTGYYGPAAAPIREYLDYAHRFVEAGDHWQPFQGGFAKSDFVTWEYLLTAHDCFERAAAAVVGDPTLERRVRQARNSVDYTIFARHEVWLQQARLRGEPFPLDPQVAALRYQLAQEENRLLLEANFSHDQVEVFYADPWCDMTNLKHDRLLPWQLLPYQEFPLPDFFDGYRPQDVLQVNLSDNVVFRAADDSLDYLLDPCSATGRAARITLRLAGPAGEARLRVAPRGTDGPTLRATLRHRGDVIERRFHCEDISQDYRIHELGTLEGVTLGSRTFLDFHPVLLPLSGFATFFEASRIKVWLSLRGTGPGYGGDPDDEDALWFDRAFLTRES